MKKHSAGLLCYRRSDKGIEALLVHPGGPFWAKKDVGAWSIPKGEFEEELEDTLAAAKREFTEETGGAAPEGDYLDLGTAKQPSGKIVHTWAVEADFDLKAFRCNTFRMEWPPKSGQQQEFQENDKAAWVELVKARQKVVKGQVVIIDALATQLNYALDKGQSDGRAEQASLF